MHSKRVQSAIKYVNQAQREKNQNRDWQKIKDKNIESLTIIAQVKRQRDIDLQNTHDKCETNIEHQK